MNRTIKEATVKRFYYENQEQLREHLANFVAAYNFAKRLKTLKGLTPYEYVCKCWTKEPQRFTSNPHHQSPGPNTLSREVSHRGGSWDDMCFWADRARSAGRRCRTGRQGLAPDRGLFEAVGLDGLG